MNSLVLSSNNLFITFLASFLVWLMFGALLCLWVINKRIKKEVALRAFIAALISWLITEAVKIIIATPRPFEITGYSPLTLTVPGTGSFPSSHSAVAFALATAILLRDKTLGIYFAIGAIGVAAGRILSNVHYIFDVLIGVWIGIVVGFTTSKIKTNKK